MKSKEELLVELALARQALSADLPELAHRCNPAARLRQSVSSHPAMWVAASTIGALAATKLLLSKKGTDGSGDGKRRALARILPVLAFLLRTTWPVTRPAVEKLLREHLAHHTGETPQETA